MTLLMGPPAASAPSFSRLADAPVRPRSVLPGRQRWEVTAVRGRPNLAQLLESSLRATPGITQAEASAVTGRVLVFHDASLDAREVARLLGRAVSQLRTRVAHSPGPAPRQAPRSARRRAGGAASGQRPLGEDGQKASGSGTGVVAVAGAGAAVALALGLGKHTLKVLARPWVSLGVVTVATTAIVRRSWRRSNSATSGSDTVVDASAETSEPRSRRGFLPRLIGPHRRKFAFAAALSVVSQALEMGAFALISYTIAVLVQGGSEALSGMGLAGLGAQLPVLAGATALAAVAATGMAYAANVRWNKLGQQVEGEWRTATFAHVQRLSTADLEGERTSRTSQVLTEDIGQLGDFVGRTMHEGVQLATCFAVLAPTYLLLAPQLAWVAFAPVPVVAWLSFRFHERTADDREKSAAARSRLNARLTDTLQANVMVKAACTEEYEDERVAELSAEHGAANHRTDRSSALQGQLVRGCALAALPGTILLGGNAVLRGELALESFTPLLDMPAIALSRLNRLGEMTDGYRRSIAAFERVERLLSLPKEDAAGSRELPAEGVRGGLDLRKVTFGYPGREPALRELSMRIAPGQVTGIVGTTGAGKTTIAKLLMRFRHPASGQVLLDGVDVRELPLRELRGAIGYVSQEPFVFDGTIAENIRYGTFDADQGRVAEAARAAGADSFIDSLPDGYDTPVGERGAALSGGQKQRISLARTILANPPVVILDEATSAVDNETEAAIQRGLDAFAHKRTLIVIAHRLSTIRNADTIYVLERGGVVAERGTHTELVQSGGKYAKLWQLQAGGPPPQPAERDDSQPPTWLRALPN
ncbi:ABC transporter ATP-binding protein/permease [Streptomyces smyrnaeus]|uniref:ABC transporter ATP-binding protein/permease n=1 Tax=Streptomyces smyrnaeus TaxID=1387713 RepID=UPI00340CA274